MLKTLEQAPPKRLPARWLRLAKSIERWAPKTQTLDDQALRKSALALRYRASSGEPLDHLLVEAFALVREAATRRLQLRHYPVQLLGGIALHFGSIAVMATGEGKTLTATLPIFLAALAGKGAHVATANDYLANRDAQQMGTIYKALGMSVGVVQADDSPEQRHDAYHCDVTYTTAKEIGFDFLRDRLTLRRQASEGSSALASMLGQNDLTNDNRTVQREFHFLLLDEADNVLIDEARTPLIVSAAPNQSAQLEAQLYRWAADKASEFSEDIDFDIDSTSQLPTLIGTGRRRARGLRLPEPLAATPLPDLYEFLQRAIHVRKHYVRDRHYVVRDDKVVIVDEFTGRLAEGRQWRTGLHQAIEANEDVDLSIATGEAARMTIQDLCLQYPRLCGMTGTVANSSRELRKIYHLRSILVPTNRPSLRQAWPELVFGSAPQKWAAIVDEVRAVHETGRPVLVGTRSIDKSELLSKLLDACGMPHVVLNARHLAREAEIISQAGRCGQITVATNMAGRGTDIQLNEDCVRIGGLHVICTELHDAARIDRQLIGRCGRQGDPGSFRQFMSLDDDIMQNGLGSAAAQRFKRMNRLSPRKLSRWTPHFFRAQKKVEGKHFQLRKMLLYRERQRQVLQREMGQDQYLDGPTQ